MAIIEIKVPGDNESAKILKALNLLLRVGEANMQAIADFGAAQREFHLRMDAAMDKIRAWMEQGGDVPEDDQMMLNKLHTEMEARVGALEELANRQAPAPPVV
jgi:hypothetical protein